MGAPLGKRCFGDVQKSSRTNNGTMPLGCPQTFGDTPPAQAKYLYRVYPETISI